MKSFKSSTDEDFEKTLFTHLLHNLDAASAIFVVNPQEAFRMVFGSESLRQLMGEDCVVSLDDSVFERMPTLTQRKVEQLWQEVLETGAAAIETDLELVRGKIIAVAISFSLFEFTGQKMMVANLRECKLTENSLHQLQGLIEKIALGAETDSLFELVALSVESSNPGLYCAIYVLNEEGTRLQIASAPSIPDSYRAKQHPLLLIDADCLCTGCVASALQGKRRILSDIGDQPCGRVCKQFIDETGVLACWSEPFFSSAQQLLGIVCVYLDRAGEPEISDLMLLQQASHLCAIIAERRAIEDTMYQQACVDPLTGLHNRHKVSSCLREEAERCRRNGLNMALLFINLDHFKEINVTLGFQFGDQLLIQAANRIRSSVRDSDVVARLAGDEFVVIIPSYKGNSNAGLIGQHIVEALNKPFLLENSTVNITASVGIAYYPDDADDIEQLLDCADQSMYAVKKSGRNGVNFFTRSLHSEVQDGLQLCKDLRNALQAGQLQVYYQPIVNLSNGRVEKAEALLRWLHPQRGMVSPDRFIPIAEEIGAIHEIGDWVFRQAAEVAVRWQAFCLNEHWDANKLQVSVNMSPLQFMHGSPDVLWIDHLQTIGLNPKAMVIEITEGLLLDDRFDVMDKLRNFHKAGMQLAMDDFGTGYSAMAYLKKFNIHFLKIDRSFVRDLETDPGDRAIAEAIVVMAHRLGLNVIAEGVETEGQRDLLAAVGCDYLQGYLYAKPMPTEEFLEFIMHYDPQLTTNGLT
jgi:diguanylate cyclase (GGDEF)-like protein